MSKPRKHADLIKAWADGAEIQRWSQSSESWVDAKSPAWTDFTEYRIKPNTFKYRIALYTDNQLGRPFVYAFYETMPEPTRAGGFVRWLTDWTEVDL